MFVLKTFLLLLVAGAVLVSGTAPSTATEETQTEAVRAQRDLFNRGPPIGPGLAGNGVPPGLGLAENAPLPPLGG